MNDVWGRGRGNRKEVLNKSREKNINIVLLETSTKYTIERSKIEKRIQNDSPTPLYPQAQQWRINRTDNRRHLLPRWH